MADYNSTFTGAEIDAVIEAVQSGNLQASLHYDQTTPSITESTNVSSVTDDSLGEYTVNFTNAFADAQYFPACIGITQPASARGGGYMGFGGLLTNDTRLASSFEGASTNAASAASDGAPVDLSNNIWRFSGPLA